MSKVEYVASIDLIVEDLDAASDFIEDITEPINIERVPGWSCYSFRSFDIMLSESALVDTGNCSGIIIHVEVSDVDTKVSYLTNQLGLSPMYGPSQTDWGTYSAIYRDSRAGFAIDIFSRID